MEISELAWIYNLKNYKEMYDLKEEEFEYYILDFPAGLSSFNAEMLQMGYDNVISGDRLYQLEPEEMEQQAAKLLVNSEKYLRKHAKMLRKNEEKYIQKILHKWQQSVNIFIQDYRLGKKTNRYRFMDLPSLPFKEHEFKLALCSDLVFHSETQEQGNHFQLVKELCRVAGEVRIFPLMNEKGEISNTIGPILLEMQNFHYGIEVREVAYEKNKGANAMLRIWSTECIVHETGLPH
jgi:hypothetical protein